MDRVRAVFGDREDDVRLAETVYYLARGFDSFEGSMLERAGELSASIRREYLSKPLTMVYDALQRLIRDDIQLDQQYSAEEMFVFVDVFRAGKYIEYLCAEQARREQEARDEQERQARERQAAEEAAAGSRPSWPPTVRSAWSRRWPVWARRNPPQRTPTPKRSPDTRPQCP